MAMSPHRPALLPVILTTLVWAGRFPTGKIALRGTPPFYVCRHAPGHWPGVPFYSISSTRARRKRDRQLAPRPVGRFLLLGFTGSPLSVGGSYQGLRLTTATNAALLNAASPIAIALLAVLFLREKMSAKMLPGIVISIVGVGVIVSRGSWQVVTAGAEPGRSYYCGHTVCLGPPYTLSASPQAGRLSAGSKSLRTYFRCNVFTHCLLAGRVGALGADGDALGFLPGRGVSNVRSALSPASGITERSKSWGLAVRGH